MDGERRGASQRTGPAADPDAPAAGHELADRLADALAVDSQRLRLLADNATDLITCHDGNKVVYVSPSCRAILGYERQEMLGMSGLRIVHPDDAPHVLDAVARCRAGSVVTFEFRARTADGSHRWLETTARALVELSTTEVTEILLSSRDITERKAVTARMAAGEARLRALLSAAPDATFRVASDGSLLEGHAGSSTPFVLPSGGVDGRHVTEFLPAALAEEVVDEIRHAVATGTTSTREFEVELEGGPHWFEVAFAPIDALEAVVIVRDVSQRVRAERALEESEARYRALVEHSSDIISVLDPDDGWRSSSPAGTRLLGYPEGFDPPGGILSLVHPDDRGRAAVALQEIRDGTRGTDDPVVLRIRAIDGRYRFVETVGQNLLDDPTVGGIVLNSRDVTDRVLAEEALRRHELQAVRLTSLQEREQLEHELEITRRLGTIGRLAGGVAHDFNSTVGLVKLYLDSLTRKLQPSSDLLDDASHIRDAIDHAGRLARQLLSTARDERVEILDPDQLVPETFDLVRPLLTGVEMIHVAGKSRSRIAIPRVRFEQVIVNLLLNARDAMPGGGTVTVAVEPLVVDASAARLEISAGYYVQIRISDAGTGMTPEVVARAFEPFFSTRTERRGTGLGLAVVHGIVTEIGGAVTIDSEPGRGTTVTVVLPARPGVVGSAAPPATGDETTGDADRDGFEA